MTKIIFTLFLALSFSVSAKLTIEQKVTLLYQTSKEKSPNNAIKEIKSHCLYLKKYDKFSPKKRVNKIFGDTKKKYLHSYKLSSFFPNLFSISTYNCVTGTALFAIIFDELDIPYSIIEVPQHVYLIAYPNSLTIAVESTDIKNGIYIWSDYSKEKAIQYLLDIKKISKSEVRVKGPDAIIERYFYSNNELNFENLIGMHFFNRALYYFERDEFTDALEYSLKANEYYENERNHIIEGSTLRNLISETENSNINIINYLLNYYKISTKKKQKELTIQTFRSAIYDAYIERKDLEYIDSTEVLINTILIDSNDISTFRGNLNLSKSIYFAIRKEYNKSLNIALEGYRLTPENKLYEDVIADLYIQQIDDFYFVDNKELIDSMENQMDVYPFLITIPSYYNYYVSSYHDVISELFIANEPEEGFKKLEWINNYVEETDIELNEWYFPSLSFLYGNIGSYYYRKKEYSLALEWVEKGLKIDPESDSLKNKKQYIKDKI